MLFYLQYYFCFTRRILFSNTKHLSDNNTIYPKHQVFELYYEFTVFKNIYKNKFCFDKRYH